MAQASQRDPTVFPTKPTLWSICSKSANVSSVVTVANYLKPHNPVGQCRWE